MVEFEVDEPLVAVIWPGLLLMTREFFDVRFRLSLGVKLEMGRTVFMMLLLNGYLNQF